MVATEQSSKEPTIGLQVVMPKQTLSLDETSNNEEMSSEPNNVNDVTGYNRKKIQTRLKTLGIPDEVYSSNSGTYYPVLTPDQDELEHISFNDILALDWSVPLPNLSIDNIREEKEFLKTSSPKRESEIRATSPAKCPVSASSSSVEQYSSSPTDDEKADPTYGITKKKTRSWRPRRKPSASRIAAQKLIDKTKQAKPKRPTSKKAGDPGSGSTQDGKANITPSTLGQSERTTPITRQQAKKRPAADSDEDHLPLTKLKEWEPKETVHHEKTTRAKGGLKVTHHGIIKRQPIKKGRSSTCDMCGQKFGNSMEFIAHYSDTHPALQCSDCSKVYTNPLSLQKHQYVHTATNKKSCGDCGKSFPFESQLTDHRRIHLKLKLRCTYPKCSAEFTHKYDLKKLERTHTETRQTCEHCDYSTTDPRNMKQHSRTHSGEKPYSCKKCGARFTFYMQKKRHSC